MATGTMNEMSGSSARLTAAILVLAAVGGAGLRVAVVLQDRPFGIDDTITYVSAAGHHSRLLRAKSQDDAPAGRWVPASEWKGLLRPDRFNSFRQTAVDLARYDLHPPLYFWGLHLWTCVAGVGMGSGLALNLLLDLAAGILLFFFARRLLGSGPLAAGAVLLWAASPATLQTFSQIRPYSFLALWAVAMGWTALRVADASRRPGAGHYVLLAAITAAGLMTHLLAGALILAVAAWLIVALRPERLRPALALVAIAAGALSCLLLHPAASAFLAHTSDVQWAEASGVVARLRHLPAAAGSFVLDPRAALALLGILGRVLAVLLAVIAVAALAALVLYVARRAQPGPWNRRDAMAPFLLLFAAMAIGAGYVAGFIPLHAMDSQYLSLCWPFLALTVAALLRPLPGAAPRVMLPLALCLAASSAMTLCLWPRFPVARDAVPSGLLASGRVIHDSVSQRWLRVAWQLDDNAPVFVSARENLLHAHQEQLSALPEGTLYISTGDDASRGSQQVLSLLAGSRRIEPVANEPGRWRLYRLTSPAPGPRSTSNGGP